jgi:hypothetical protein
MVMEWREDEENGGKDNMAIIWREEKVAKLAGRKVVPLG